MLLSDAFDVEQMHWLDSVGLSGGEQPIDCAVKTRYRQSDLDCSVRASGAATWHVALRRPARAVTPGQYAVFYRGALCLGGGVIARRSNERTLPAGRGINYNSEFSVEGS